jgi:uncharacterized protein YpiB (UPF0302 family)
MTEKTPISNTPKGIDAEGNATVPSAYKVLRFECINQDGVEYDIFRIVKSFTITEELMSPVLVLNIRVRDTINFFEDFVLSGQERIILELERDNGNDRKQRIKLSFSVKEYPNYQKLAAEPNVQEYNIIAVSDFAYTSMLNRISRSIKGNPVDNIQRIFAEDLNVMTNVKSVCVSSFDGIVTIQSPLKAIEWLRTKSFDSESSPIFVFSTISDSRVIIQSIVDMWGKSNPVLRKYVYRQYLQNRTGTPEFYAENANRILDMKSNIKLDKLMQAIEGGFASTTNIVDVASKTYVQTVFDYMKDPSVSKTRLNIRSPFSLQKSLLSGLVSSGLKSINNFSSANLINISANSSGNDGNPNSSTSIVSQAPRVKSYYANMKAVSHTIQVYGDFELNPGRKIRIEIPKAVNIEQYAGSSDNDTIDESLSGDYIVGVVAHTFSDGLYTSKVQIIKDA